MLSRKRPVSRLRKNAVVQRLLVHGDLGKLRVHERLAVALDRPFLGVLHAVNQLVTAVDDLLKHFVAAVLDVDLALDQEVARLVEIQADIAEAVATGTLNGSAGRTALAAVDAWLQAREAVALERRVQELEQRAAADEGQRKREAAARAATARRTGAAYMRRAPLPAEEIDA